jgi:nucleoside-diphosphate-sugar epimerase
MKVFVTGATGYIGGSIAKVLVDQGYIVLGLVRNNNKINALRNIGVEPVLGTLEDKSILVQCAQSSDAVINAANSDHRDSIETIIEALCGTGKTFVHTSGSSVVGDDALGEYEDDKIYSDDAAFTPISIRKERADINNFVRIAGVKDGIRTMVITPPMIYGNTLGLPAESDQLPKLIYKSKEKMAGIYIGKGLNRWSNVHIKDLVNLYLLALEKGPSAVMFFAENGEESFLTIAQSISMSLGFGGKTVSWPIAEAIKEFGDWARFAIGSNSRIKAINARKLLNWEPEAESILMWIEKNANLKP